MAGGHSFDFFLKSFDEHVIEVMDIEVLQT